MFSLVFTCVHLCPLVSTCFHLFPLVFTCVHFGSLVVFTCCLHLVCFTCFSQQIFDGPRTLENEKPTRTATHRRPNGVGGLLLLCPCVSVIRGQYFLCKSVLRLIEWCSLFRKPSTYNITKVVPCLPDGRRRNVCPIDGTGANDARVEGGL